MVFTAIRDEIAEFLAKTEWKESKNTQNILLVGCYILFDEYARKKNLLGLPVYKH